MHLHAHAIHMLHQAFTDRLCVCFSWWVKDGGRGGRFALSSLQPSLRLPDTIHLACQSCIVQQALQVAPGHVPTLARLARLWLEAGNAQRAASWAVQAVELQPEDPDLQELAGSCLWWGRGQGGGVGEGEGEGPGRGAIPQWESGACIHRLLGSRCHTYRHVQRLKGALGAPALQLCFMRCAAACPAAPSAWRE